MTFHPTASAASTSADIRGALTLSLLLAVVACSDSDAPYEKTIARFDQAIATLKSIPTPARKSLSVSPTVPSIPDPYAVRRALRAGDAAILKSYLPQLVKLFENGDISERDFHEGVRAFTSPLPEAIPVLDRWVTESPREYAPLLARGMDRSQLVIERRGTEAMRFMPEPQRARLREQCNLAADDLVAALSFSPRPVTAIDQLIMIGRVCTPRRKQIQALFDEGIRIAPDSAALYGRMVLSFYSNWGGGSVRKAEDFLAKARANGIDPEVWTGLESDVYNVRNDYELGRDPEANLEYTVVDTENYDTYAAWIRRARLEIQRGATGAAAQSLERAAQKRPGAVEVFELRGSLFESRGMFAEAIAQYRMAMERESPWAYEKLIYAYSSGQSLGLPKDMDAMRALCEESAALHHGHGEWCLGWLYHNGFAEYPQDDRKAAEWEQRAAEHQNPISAHNRGWRLVIGKGVPADRVEGVYWLRKAARLGHKQSVDVLKQLGEPVEDPATRVSWYARMRRMVARMIDG